MGERLAYLDGRILPLAEARVSILDRGLLYGDGLFETVRVRGGRAVRLGRHLARLHSGAAVLGFGNSLDDVDFRDIVSAVLEANGLRDARVRLTVTRGPSEGPGRLVQSGSRPTVIMTADPLPEPVPEPARVIVSSIRRDETNPLCSVKSLNYLPGILARAQAQRSGADDALLLNTRGNVAEGTVSNVFLVKGNSLVTPSLDQGVLAGIARGAVLEIAPELDLEASEGAVSLDQLTGADEVFFTNAIQLVRPVSEIDGGPIGTGDYPVSAGLLEALDAVS